MKAILFALSAVLLSIMFQPAFAADALRYDWRPGRTFAYEVKIVADEPDAVATYTGLVEYTVDATGKLKYQGGLKKSEKKKSSGKARPSGFGFPPSMARIPFGPVDPFSRRVSPFKGLEQATNHLELNAQGRVISIKGSSHLPYLLGHLSLLPFEPLDKAGADTWEIESGIIISEARDRVEPVFPFGGPRGPFEPRNTDPDGKKTSGGQVNTYQVVKATAEEVEIEKTTHLETSVGKDGENTSVEGRGTWVFNRNAQLPESLDFSHTLVYQAKNQTLKLPVTIRINRLSEEAWTKIEADRAAESKQRQEAHEKRMAEQKSRAEAPLTPEELAASLKDLSSRSARVLAGRLKKLNGKSTQDPHPELADALRPLTHHADQPIRAEAEKALAKFDPAYQELYTVLAAYRKGSEVEESPFPVSPDLELPLGLIVLYRERDAWYPGKVIGETDKGEVELKQVRWPHRDKTATRSNLRLADPRAEQPHVPTRDLAQIYGEAPATGRLRIALRTWTDASGSFQVEGTYQALENNVVHLTLKNGKKAEVPLDKLCPADREYVQQIQARPRDQNPFKIAE